MSQYGFGAGADPEFGGPQPGMAVDGSSGGFKPAPAAPLTEADFTLDFSDAKDVPVFTPIPAGEYTLMIDSAEPVRATTGAPMVNLQTRVWDPGPYEGRQIRGRIVLPNPAKRAADPDKFQRSIDFTCADLEAITGEKWKGVTRTLNPQRDLQNRVARAYVTIKPNHNDPNLKHNEIARWLPKDSAAPTSSGAPTGFGGFGG